MSLDITAHQYNVNSSSPSSFHVLETARKVVDAATSTSSEWRFIAPSLKSAPNSSSCGSCFVWARELPVINRSIGATQGGAHELYDWDAPMEDFMDVIIPLPEFEGTDFRDIISHPKSQFTKRPQPSHSTPHGRCNIANNVDVNADTRPRKRLCTQCESHASASATISISRLIPLPHYYESPDPARPPPPGIDEIPAFRVARSLSPSTSLTMPFARTAWLVPLRGVPPIEGASAAHLDNVLTYEREVPDESFPRTIHWTSVAVTQFWDFLLRQRNANNFGPIAFAYLLSPPSIQRVHREKRVARWRDKFGEGDSIRTMEERRRLKQSDKQVAEVEDCVEIATAKVWEYIKIYHDSQYAMKLRSLLDSFRWEDDTDEIRRTTASNALPLQRRVLKAIRLVLVDETGDAILLA